MLPKRLAGVLGTIPLTLDRPPNIGGCFGCLLAKTVLDSFGKFLRSEMLVWNWLGPGLCLCYHGAPEVLAKLLNVRTLPSLVP